jgi:hypothetical protein
VDASCPGELEDQSVDIKKLDEQEVKQWVQGVCSFKMVLKLVSGQTDFFELGRLSEETEKASEVVWLKYEKLSDQERIEWWDDQSKRVQRLSDYSSQMKRKYENAARSPRLPVEPDPPVPD